MPVQQPQGTINVSPEEKKAYEPIEQAATAADALTAAKAFMEKYPTSAALPQIEIAVYNKIAYVGGFNGWGFIVGNGADGSGFQPLNLRPGDLVRVKSLSQIKETLDPSGKHQHLLFAPAMTHFCGRVLRVRNRVDMIILEGTRSQLPWASNRCSR